jgi:arylsulfatase A-like enzyme
MKQPNILYINPDQMRADALACYGHPVIQTPNFDRLAAMGVRYDQCHVQHSVCTPSRCSFMTGWYPHVRGHRTLWHPLGKDEPNTLKYLKQGGYDVHWIGKNDLLAEDAFHDSVTAVHEWKWPGEWSTNPFEFGKPGYFSFLMTAMPGETMDESCYHRAIKLVRDKQDAKKPWMIYLPTLYPHCPFTCPEPWYSMYDPEEMPDFRPSELENKPTFYHLIRQYRQLDEMDPAVFKKIAAVYLGMISYQDHLLGQLLDTLEETGQMDDTAIFMFSDHGEWAGDYGLVEKWQSGLDDCLTRVPMIVKTPGNCAGHVVEAPIECFDIVPTTLELAGIPLKHTQFGQSMMATQCGSAGNSERAVFAEGGYDPHETHCYEGMPGGYQDIGDNSQNIYYPKGLQQQEQPLSSSRCTMIRTATHKLVRRPLDVSELYDLVKDPGETQNVYGTTDYAGVQADLEMRMLDWYIHTSDVVPFKRQNRNFPEGLLVS